MRDKLTYYVTLMVTATLCLVIISMVGALLIGLFTPNELIDNKDVFGLIGPAFQTIVGGFIGLLAAVKMSSMSKPDDPVQPPEE
mgnify:FL=1